MIGEVTAISLDHNLRFVDESNVEGEFTISGSYKLTEASRLEEKFSFTVPADIILGEKLDLTTTKIEIDDFYYEIDNDDTMNCYIDVQVEGVEKIEDIEEVRIEKIKPSPEEEPKVEQNTKIEEAKIEEPSETKEEVKEEVLENKELVEDKINETEQIPTAEIAQPEEKEMKTEIPEVPKIYSSIEDQKQEDRECDGDLATTEKNEEERPKKEMENQEMKEESQLPVSEESEEESSASSVGSLFSSLKESDETFSTYSVYILRQEETVQSIIEKYKTTKEELENYNDLSELTVGSKIIIPVNSDE